MYSQIDQNKRKTWLVMAMFFVIIAIIAGLVRYTSGKNGPMFLILGVSAVYALIQYFLASRLMLAMSGAKPIEKKDNPRFYNIVENLAITTGLPMPKVYIINDASPNAFATGRDPEHASVAATTGLIDLLADRELNGVMAHEMAHIGDYDIRVSLIAFALTVMISFMADLILRIGFHVADDDDAGPFGWVMMLLASILAPIAATLVQLAVSRKREFLADATASLTTRDPEALASALEKLRDDKTKLRHLNSSMANMYINNPSKKGFVSKMFSTHPPIDERITILRGMINKF